MVAIFSGRFFLDAAGHPDPSQPIFGLLPQHPTQGRAALAQVAPLYGFYGRCDCVADWIHLAFWDSSSIVARQPAPGPNA